MSIQRREIGGKMKYIVRFRDPYGKERSKSFDKLKLAKSWDAERLRSAETGTWANPEEAKITVRTMCERRARATGKTNTRSVRDNLVKNLGPLAHRQVSDVNRVQIQEWVNLLRDGRPWMGGKPLGPRSIESLLGQLSAGFQELVEDDILAKSPCQRIVKPHCGPSVLPEEVPTPGMVQSVVAAAERQQGPSLALLLRTMARSGLRPSEACALRVGDVDPEEGVIHVRQQMGKSRLDGMQDLKTVASSRRVPVPREVTAPLMEAGKGKAVGDFLFVRDGPRTRLPGEPWIGNIISHAMTNIRKEAGAPEWFSAHSLRHFFASQMIHRGVNIRAVSAALGHAKTTTTLEVYTHLLPESGDLVRGAISLMVRDSDGISSSESDDNNDVSPVQDED